MRIVICEMEIDSIVLTKPKGNVIDENDPMIWEVRAAEARSLDSFLVGEAPEGFETTIRLTQALAENDLFAIVIGREEETVLAHGFRRSELREGRISYGGNYVSLEEFRNEADC